MSRQFSISLPDGKGNNLTHNCTMEDGVVTVNNYMMGSHHMKIGPNAQRGDESFITMCHAADDKAPEQHVMVRDMQKDHRDNIKNVLEKTKERPEIGQNREGVLELSENQEKGLEEQGYDDILKEAEEEQEIGGR